MSKELEALERIRRKLSAHYDVDKIFEWSIVDDDLNDIEKSLKVLNVFKELKFFDVRCDNENGKMIYLLVWNAVSICRISKEQYDSLKEVLL